MKQALNFVDQKMFNVLFVHYEMSKTINHRLVQILLTQPQTGLIYYIICARSLHIQNSELSEKFDNFGNEQVSVFNIFTIVCFSFVHLQK